MNSHHSRLLFLRAYYFLEVPIEKNHTPIKIWLHHVYLCVGWSKLPYNVGEVEIGINKYLFVTKLFICKYFFLIILAMKTLENHKYVVIL